MKVIDALNFEKNEKVGKAFFNKYKNVVPPVCLPSARWLLCNTL